MHIASATEELRIYFNGAALDCHYQLPGFADITHDMNSTTVAEEGAHLGLKTLFYGKQEQLSKSHYPNEIFSDDEKLTFAKQSFTGNFKVIVQRKNDPEKKDDALSSTELAERYKQRRPLLTLSS